MTNYLEDLSGVLHGVAMDNYFEHLSGVLQSFGAAGIVLLVVPVLITVLARDVPRVLYTCPGLVHAFCCPCFCSQCSSYPERARLFRCGAGKHRCA